MTFLHQVKHVLHKDLARFWPGLVALAALGSYQRFFGLPPTYTLGVPFAGQLPIFTLAMVTLAAIVVQDDPAASQSAHWRTTPLSPGAVFGAKTTFLGLFLCLIPALAQVQWVASLAPVANPTGMLLDSLLFQGGLLAAVALGASITPNLGAFLTLAFVAWFGLEFFESSMMVWGGERWPGAGEMLTRAWTLHVAGLVLGGGLFMHQYLTRHVVRTSAVAIAGFALTGIGLTTLQPDFSSGPMSPEKRVPYADAESIGLEVAYLNRTTPSTSGRREDWVMGTLDAAGPGVGLRVTGSRTTLVGPDLAFDMAFDADAGWENSIFGPGGTLPGMKPAGPWSADDGQPNRLQVPLVRARPEVVTEMARATAWSTTVSIDAFDFNVQTRLPLIEGESRLVEAGRLTVVRISRGDRTLTVEVRLDAAPRALRFATTGVAGNPAGLTLHNTRYDDFLVAAGSGGGRSYQQPRALAGGARYQPYVWTLSFEEPQSVPEESGLPQDWFEDVELVVIGAEYLGSFERTVELDAGRWPEPNGFVDFNLRTGGRP